MKNGTLSIVSLFIGPLWRCQQ